MRLVGCVIQFCLLNSQSPLDTGKGRSEAVAARNAFCATCTPCGMVYNRNYTDVLQSVKLYNYQEHYED